nr:MAG TPA: hypothetical protein [Caudoviricetes sp.]
MNLSTLSPISLSHVRSNGNEKDNDSTCSVRRRTVCAKSSMFNL